MNDMNDINEKIKVLFVAGFGPIPQENKKTHEFYKKTLGIPFTDREKGYSFTEKLQGVKHFAIWPLTQAAQSCFGTNNWPEEITKPQAWIEFDVENIKEATKELKTQGYKLLTETKKEPWGQTVTRLLSPEGILTSITHTPHLRKET